MAFADSILDDSIKKNTLVVVRPRKRITGWTSLGSNRYSAPFTLGEVSRVIFSYPGNILEEGASSAVGVGEWYYDGETVFVYSTTDPDSFDYPGATVEYELYLSTEQFQGPKDPLDSTSKAVTWVPALQEAPFAQNGSRDSIIGFTPLNQSAIRILNLDGWLNEHLYDCSFNLSFTKGYIICGDNYDEAVRQSDIAEIFIGYTTGMSVRDEVVTLPVTDFFSFFNRAADLEIYDAATFPNAQPEAKVAGAEWSIRKVYGFVQGVRPVNIDFSATPTTSNNRVWSTHFKDFSGVYSQAIDVGAANTATRTYFSSEPKFQEGDAIKHSGADTDYGFVTNVNRVSNYIDHSSLTRTVTAGDIISHSPIARVYITDEDGTVLGLSEDSDYTVTNGTNDWRIDLVNNFEASYLSLGGTFDPSKHILNVDLYGTNVLPVLSDNVTDLNSLSNYGGVMSKASTVLYQLLIDSGLDQSLIDENSFQNIDTDHALGLQFPFNQEGNPPTYKELIQQVLSSMLWKLGFIFTNNRIKIGIIEVRPFVSSADYEVNTGEFSQLSFEHDYSDIYSRFVVDFSPREYYRPFYNSVESYRRATASSVGSDLHFLSAETLNLTLNHYVGTEASVAAERYSYVFGDRRGLYEMIASKDSVLEGNLGASIDLVRESLPGFAFVRGTDRTRQLNQIEVQKSASGARLVLEDQKGIQENSGDW